MGKGEIINAVTIIKEWYIPMVLMNYLVLFGKMWQEKKQVIQTPHHLPFNVKHITRKKLFLHMFVLEEDCKHNGNHQCITCKDKPYCLPALSIFGF